MNLSDLSGVRYDVADGVGTIWLARPDSANAIDLVTARSLGSTVDAALADDAVRVVLVRGEGARFCAGGDASWMAAAADPAAALLELAEVLDGVLQRLAAGSKPVIAAVQGAAAGAGLGVVLAADVVVATRSARFLTAYAAIGLTPDCGVSWLLPRVVGQGRALELALTGRVLSAEEAQSWGLVTTVVDDDGLPDAVSDLAARMAAAPPFALGQARRLIRGAAEISRTESGSDEARTIAAAVLTPEAQAAVRRFAPRG